MEHVCTGRQRLSLASALHLVCTLLSATFLRACTLERLFVAHNPNERRPKLPRPTGCGAQQSAVRCDIDPSRHSLSERSPIAHVLVSLALAPNDAQPKSPPPNLAPSQKRAVQYFLDPVKRHPLLSGTDITNLHCCSDRNFELLLCNGRSKEAFLTIFLNVFWCL